MTRDIAQYFLKLQMSRFKIYFSVLLAASIIVGAVETLISILGGMLFAKPGHALFFVGIVNFSFAMLVGLIVYCFWLAVSIPGLMIDSDKLSKSAAEKSQ